MIRFASAAAALVLVATAATAYAQMPTDNDSWKARCTALSVQATDLNHLSPAAVALTRGVSAAKFQTFAFDREAANQHNVACTLFYLAAIANKAGNGGKADASAAQDSQLLASLEVKAIHGQQASFGESISRTRIKALEIARPSLTVDDEEKVVIAATTIPFGVNVASNQAHAVNYNSAQQPRVKR